MRRPVDAQPSNTPVVYHAPDFAGYIHPHMDGNVAPSRNPSHAHQVAWNACCMCGMKVSDAHQGPEHGNSLTPLTKSSPLSDAIIRQQTTKYSTAKHTVCIENMAYN